MMKDNCAKQAWLIFCIVGAVDLRPIVAFSVSRDELKSKVFNSFGLPLLNLRELSDK